MKKLPSKTKISRRAKAMSSDDKRDIALARERLRSPGRIYSASEVKEELGLSRKRVRQTQPARNNTKGHVLAGVWISADEYASVAEYSVKSKGRTFSVKAIDGVDGDVADIFEVKWDGEILSFATYWNSTGRFLRCRLQALSKNRVSLTYTYTDNETYHRKSE